MSVVTSYSHGIWSGTVPIHSMPHDHALNLLGSLNHYTTWNPPTPHTQLLRKRMTKKKQEAEEKAGRGENKEGRKQEEVKTKKRRKQEEVKTKQRSRKRGKQRRKGSRKRGKQRREGSRKRWTQRREAGKQRRKGSRKRWKQRGGCRKK